MSSDSDVSIIEVDQEELGESKNQICEISENCENCENYDNGSFKLMGFSYLCSENSEKYSDLNYTNKILLPESVLYGLQNNKKFENIEFPLFFNVKNTETQFGIVCGVHEFTSPPGVCHMPYHIMSLLGIDEGTTVHIELNECVGGDFVKFRFHTSKFASIPDSKKLLEKIISKDYPVISTGQTLILNHKETGEIYNIDVLETKPVECIKILNSNINVDFDTPLDGGGEEKSAIPLCPEIASDNFKVPERLTYEKLKKYKPWSNGFVPFSGQGHRLGTK